MEVKSKTFLQIFLTLGTLIGWFAILAQLYLVILNRTTSVLESIIRFFSFYTILTNILVSTFFSTLLLKPNSRLGKIFSQPKVAAAITLYITVVGVVYNLVLRRIWNPQGLQMVVDELLHVAIPLYFILYWLKFADKAELKWKSVFPWLAYPLLYVIYILFRGALSEFYPYPFLDVTALGYNGVFINISGLCISFLLGGFLFVLVAKIMNRTLF